MDVFPRVSPSSPGALPWADKRSVPLGRSCSIPLSDAVKSRLFTRAPSTDTDRPRSSTSAEIRPAKRPRTFPFRSREPPSLGAPRGKGRRDRSRARTDAFTAKVSNDPAPLASTCAPAMAKYSRDTVQRGPVIPTGELELVELPSLHGGRADDQDGLGPCALRRWDTVPLGLQLQPDPARGQLRNAVGWGQSDRR